MVPASPELSSIIYRFQTPFAWAGVLPTNFDVKVAVPAGGASSAADGAGAGAANVSPVFTSVGRKVPETSGPASGSREPAASLSVMVRLAAAVPPPTSDHMIYL